MVTWFSISGPKGLPKDVVDKLDAVAKKLTGDQAFIKEYESISYQVRYRPSGEMRDFVLKEMDTFKALAPQSAQTK